MKKFLLAAVLLGALIAPATAQADLYMSKREAASSTRQVVRDRYGDDVTGYIGVYCHPRGLTQPEPSYIYRYWICAWAAEHYWDSSEICYGKLRISGDRQRDYFRWGVQRGMRCA